VNCFFAFNSGSTGTKPRKTVDVMMPTGDTVAARLEHDNILFGHANFTMTRVVVITCTMFKVYAKTWRWLDGTMRHVAARNHWNRVQEQVCGDRRTFAVGAVDWKATQGGSLNVDVYQNDQDLLGDDYEPLKRIAKPIDRTLPSCIV
jgi:hypothetical protein